MQYGDGSAHLPDMGVGSENDHDEIWISCSCGWRYAGESPWHAAANVTDPERKWLRTIIDHLNAAIEHPYHKCDVCHDAAYGQGYADGIAAMKDDQDHA